MLRKIVNAKDPILRLKAKPVAKVDKKIKQIATDLTDTLKIQKDPEGVGLAAPQIGKSLRMFAMVHGKIIRVIINPEIQKIIRTKTPPAGRAGKKNKREILEGCLSIPYLYGPLKRPQKLILNYLDLEGKKQTETFTGFPAQIVQHEVDHLNGILFIDKLLKTKNPLLYKVDPKTDEMEEVELM